MAFVGKASTAAILVLLTLLLQNTGMAALIYWTRVRHTQGYPLGVLGSCFFDGANHECDLCPTFVTDPTVGRILSLEVYSVVGGGVLLLGIQLFDRRLWGGSSAAGMAEPGTNRRCHGRPNVRAFNGASVCHRAPARSG